MPTTPHPSESPRCLKNASDPYESGFANTQRMCHLAISLRHGILWFAVPRAAPPTRGASEALPWAVVSWPFRPNDSVPPSSAQGRDSRRAFAGSRIASGDSLARGIACRIVIVCSKAPSFAEISEASRRFPTQSHCQRERGGFAVILRVLGVFPGPDWPVTLG